MDKQTKKTQGISKPGITRKQYFTIFITILENLMKTRGKLTEGILDGILKLILKGKSGALNKAFNNDPAIQKATKETEEALDTWEQTLVRMAKQGSPSAKKALSDLRKYRNL